MLYKIMWIVQICIVKINKDPEFNLKYITRFQL